jgi:diguanylate cyclase (GGDEF)-like protein/putative nucleotidyltransferase with HDIG domain
MQDRTVKSIHVEAGQPPRSVYAGQGGGAQSVHTGSGTAPKPVQWFIGVTVGLGSLMLAAGIAQWEFTQPLEWCFLLLIAVIAAGMRFHVPNVTGTLSPDFVFVLIGIARLSLTETLFIGCSVTAVQVIRRRTPPQAPLAALLFPIAITAIAVFVSHVAFSTALAANVHWLLALLPASLVLFVMRAFPIAAVNASLEGCNLAGMWQKCNLGAYPYYLAAAGLAAFLQRFQEWSGVNPIPMLAPAALWSYWRDQRRLQRVIKEKDRAETMAALHLRTIEALAGAIEAKDVTSYQHLRRLQVYCCDLGRELNLPEEQIEALRAAAVLHDIGKLAVPEHILSKPRRLTRDEYERLKIHPTVGAEILERVGFPYPVAPIVRHHHEKWNGGGYPSGLRGEAIPIGARILAAVDALDGMLSERPYRTATAMESAIARIRAGAGAIFDPQVVQTLERRYADLERQLEEEGSSAHDLAQSGVRQLALAVRDDSGGAEIAKPAFLDTIAAARQEAQVILELEQLLGRSLRLDETLPALAGALRRVLDYDTLAVYLVQGRQLTPRYATGEGASVLMSHPMEIGSGLCGWVAQHAKPALNGNPWLELGVNDDNAARLGMLGSALVVPLPSSDGIAGTLMLCRKGFSSFTKDHLRVLQAVSAKLGSVLENAQKFEQASASATTDFLTGLPNARALFLRLESELARCRRLGGSLTVMVTDLDGFKQVNDRFGHLQGNAVLQEVGASLRGACREYDYVARMGGDEFVLLLPGLQDSDAAIKVSLLNSIVADAGRRACAESNLGLSAGQASFPEDGDDPERLLAVADQRMYLAKQTRKLRRHRDAPRGYDFDHTETLS